MPSTGSVGSDARAPRQVESLWATANFVHIVPVPTDPAERLARKLQMSDRFNRMFTF